MTHHLYQERDWRELTRHRTTLMRERASAINRLQKVLEWANPKLALVVTDISGLSALLTTGFALWWSHTYGLKLTSIR